MSDQEPGSCIIEEANTGTMTTEDKAMEPNADNNSPSKESKSGFVSKLQEYEAMFPDRYSDKDASYMERVDATLQPMIIHPFGGRDQQQWQNRGRRDDGGQFDGERRGGSFRRGGHRNYNDRNRHWEQRR